MTAHVRTVLTGRVQPLGRTVSGIAKQPVSGPQRVEHTGFVTDEQADLRVHGGADKAVLCYAWSHYAAWRSELPGVKLLETPGAFGENLSVEGLTERGVCIGDRLRVGTALFAVSQGRQPCFKLNLRFDLPDMAERVQHSLRPGWYLRVVEPGIVAAGDPMEVVERPHPSHTVADLLTAIRDRETRPEILEPILQLPLPDSWRGLFERRLHRGMTESWTRRLGGGA